MKLTIIGTGNMAKALIKGLYTKYELEILGRDDVKLNIIKKAFPKIEINQIQSSNIKDKIVILCIKPYVLKTVSSQLQNKASIIISILAGTTIEKIKNHIKSTSYIRAMPNIAALLHKSMTTLTGDIKEKTTVIEIFNQIGKTLWVENEKQLDIATAISGSGPAFLALISEGLIDGGVKAGLDRNRSTILVKGLFEGFTNLLNIKSPSLIKDEVMSPDGTTAAGYAKLEELRVRSAMIESIQTAYNKALKLSEK
jgi:pyrroline-5-carboxylate reductase